MKKTGNSFEVLSTEFTDPCDYENELEQLTGKLKPLKLNDVKTSANKSDGNAAVVRLRWPLVWIDLEMTGIDFTCTGTIIWIDGLNVEEDRILEIACIITDGHLKKMVEGPDLIISQSTECLAKMNEWCQNHHSASGLVEQVKKSTLSEEDAELQIIDFVKQHTGPSPPSLAGNSIYVDFIFIKKYMPKLAALFSHVVVDVSSIKALCFRWYPKEADSAPKKKNSHRALDDIKDSITELRYLKKTIFK